MDTKTEKQTINHNTPPAGVILQQSCPDHPRWFRRIKELCQNVVGTSRVFDTKLGKVRGRCVGCDLMGCYSVGRDWEFVVKLIIETDNGWQHILYVNRLYNVPK